MTELTAQRMPSRSEWKLVEPLAAVRSLPVLAPHHLESWAAVPGWLLRQPESAQIVAAGLKSTQGLGGRSLLAPRRSQTMLMARDIPPGSNARPRLRRKSRAEAGPHTFASGSRQVVLPADNRGSAGTARRAQWPALPFRALDVPVPRRQLARESAGSRRNCRKSGTAHCSRNHTGCSGPT